MTLITIRETGNNQATISFDRQGEYPISVSDPFSEEEEERLEWYFERWLRFPFVDQVKAQRAAVSVLSYGERLFEQVFKGDFGLYGRYSEARQAGVNELRFEIVGSAEFQRLHWEALKDPDLPRPFVLDALMVRSVLTPAVISAKSQLSPTINLLLVVARPSGGRDVGFRTISRPLVESLRQIRQPVRIEILRPGTYKALLEHLRAVRDEHGVGFYHIIHFDLHGALMTHQQVQQGIEANRYLYQQRFGRADLPPYEGEKAFLFFSGKEEGQADPASASEVANLLIQHQIPIAILNACQSGKQTGASAGSLASRLMTAGVQTVLAMAYSVTVSAAKLMMTTLYGQLLGKNDLAVAIRHAREALYNHKERRVYFDQLIDLEDWLLPLVYQSGGAQRLSSLPLRKPTSTERRTYFLKRATRYQAPPPEYGFVGRDVDILHIEKRLLTQSEGKLRNLLLIRGMGGAGKTTLLQHLGAWWQTTHFVNEVFYFGYDQKAWTLSQIMHQLATKTIVGQEREMPLGEWTSYPLEVQQEILVSTLLGRRHLLILDNLESITGENLAIPNTLPPNEREALRTFLANLLDGQTLVLLGTRGGEAWLTTKGPLRPTDIYDLPGLDKEAASTLAQRILERHVSDHKKRNQYRQSTEFNQLLKLLDGYPLPLEVVLSNLAHQTPTEILQALQAGDDTIDFKSQDKTKSILRCIDYSHSNLSPDAQKLLLCLAPFTGVFNILVLNEYTAQLKQQPALAELSVEQWPSVLQEAINWGLLSPQPKQAFILRLQPIYPYFLRTCLNDLAQQEVRLAIETAFCQYYQTWGRSLADLFLSKNAKDTKLARILVNWEFKNLVTALNYALAAQISIFKIYRPLSLYLDALENHSRGLLLGQTVLALLERYPADKLAGELCFDYVSVIDEIAKRQFLLKRYNAAQASYQKVLAIWLKNDTDPLEQVEKTCAGIYHQLGALAEKQRQWTEALKYYQRALQIFINQGDRHSQATVYHQLGLLAEAQRQWEEAEQYYQQALQIKEEFKDHRSQAVTYHQLGKVAEAQRQSSKAKEYYQRALQICFDEGDRYLSAKILHHLGVLAQQQRQLAQAEQYYQHALQIFLSFNDQYSQAIVYHQLGQMTQEGREWEQAKQYYQKALQIFIDKDDFDLQANVYHHLGAVAKGERQWKEAVKYYQRALKIMFEQGDRYSQGKIYQHLGIVAQELRRWGEAKQHYQQALQIYLDFKDIYSQGEVYHDLGLIAQELRQWEGAKQLYERALQIKIYFDDRYSQAKTYHHLGRVAEEQQEWQKAKEYYLRALQIKIDFDDRYSQAKTYFHLGSVAQKQQQWAEAQKHYQYARQIFTEFDDRHSQAKIYHNLGVMAQKQRQWAEAKEHYQHALQIKDEFNERYQKAGTYKQLGLLALGQEQWIPARQNLLLALEIFHEAKDLYNMAHTMAKIAKLWQACQHASILVEVAALFGLDVAKTETWFSWILEENWNKAAELLHGLLNKKL